MAALDFAEVKTKAQELEAAYSDRNIMFQDMEDMFLLEPKDIPGEDWIKATVSPDPRNALLGVIRLMTGTDPKFSVPVTTNNPQTKRSSSKIERLCSAVWQANGNIQGRPVHYDAILSAFLYGELHLMITLTSDLVKLAKTPAQKQQAEDIAATTPFVIECVSPVNGYPDFGRFGLRSYYSRRKMTVGEIRDRWGEDQLAGKKNSEEIDYHDYFDMDNHVVWLEGESEPLLNEPHNLPFIPVVAVITEGSLLFQRPQQQTRQPFLYTEWKSKLWDRKNLALTLMYSLTFAIGSNPIFVWRRNDTTKTAPERDYSTPGGLVVLDPGEEFVALAKQIIDPSIMVGLQTAQSLSEESTIFKQTLGQPIGGNAPFSMVALLSQSGRQVLISFQRMASHAIGRAMYIGLEMAKKLDGGSLKAIGTKGLVDITANDIPDTFTLEANLDVSMPQDDRQNAAVAVQLTSGQKPIASLRWVRENLMNIPQSDDMDKEIFDESYSLQVMAIKQQMQIQQMLAKLQQQQPQPGQPGQPGQLPPGAMPQGQPQPGGMPQDLAAQMQGQLQSTGAEPGLPGMPAGAPVEPGAPGVPGGAGQNANGGF